jgi:hypothetical protein
MLTVHSEFGILISKETSALTEGDSFTLTTNMALFSKLVGDPLRFVGLTQSFALTDLTYLLQSQRMSKFFVIVFPEERTAAHCFLGVHRDLYKRFIVIDCGLSNKTFKTEEWVAIVLASDQPGDRLLSVRKRIKLMIDSPFSSKSVTSPDDLLKRYTKIYDDKIRKDDFRKALALNRVRVSALYNKSIKRLLDHHSRRKRILSPDQIIELLS